MGVGLPSWEYNWYYMLLRHVGLSWLIIDCKDSTAFLPVIERLIMSKVRCFDVAAYILKQKTSMTAMKLQKLVYYCQAWSLVWDEKPLFPEKIEAWANGPVVRELYDWHKGSYEVHLPVFDGDPDKLSKAQRETVDSVLKYYGDKPAQWLSDLTHLEAPWQLARTGVSEGAPSDAEISLESMNEFYSSLLPGSELS
jgi:uncharacterized phage-associated protein